MNELVCCQRGQEPTWSARHAAYCPLSSGRTQFARKTVAAPVWTFSTDWTEPAVAHPCAGPVADWLTSWGRGLLQKLTVPQLVKKFPTFHRARWFNTAFAKSAPSHSTYSVSVLILYSRLRLTLRRCPFPSLFTTRILFVFLFLSMRAM